MRQPFHGFEHVAHLIRLDFPSGLLAVDAGIARPRRSIDAVTGSTLAGLARESVLRSRWGPVRSTAATLRTELQESSPHIPDAVRLTRPARRVH